MKNCPFCKRTIESSKSICPHCQRVLAEKITTAYNKKTNDIHQEKKHQQPTFQKLSDFEKYIPIIVLAIVIIFIASQKSSNSFENTIPISVIPDKEKEKNDLLEGLGLIASTPTSSTEEEKHYISLPNGTIFNKNSYYLNGSGELEIKNGTSYDTVAKLVNPLIKKSIFTVYIKANSDYNINKISDGNYKLYFNLGIDWDDEIKAFMINSSYEVFEDIFDYATTESIEGEYIKTEYATFNVTLNPVINGEAETEDVNALEFAKY